MTGAELRELLERRWAERRGRPIDEALSEFGIPRGAPDGIEWIGAERVADRQARMAETGKVPPRDYPGVLWLDGFVAGLAVRGGEDA